MREQPYTAAILLGASRFPLHSETYAPNGAFLRSKQDFRAYLQDTENGLALADEAICDLFDLEQLPSQQLVSIGRFLEKASKQVDRDTLCNLIVYYVGHGYFAGQRQEYHVALSCLEMGYDATTGLKISELAEVLKERARSFRRFVILDCCFAAEALKEFQGAAEDAIYAKAKGAFAEDTPRRPVAVPRRGTALYCAADKDHVARSPHELPRTMFSDALLEVLRSGDRQYSPYLTLAEIKELAWEKLQSYPNPVRPVLHSPDQTEGDIAAIVELFPNRGVRGAMSPESKAPSQGHEPRHSQESVAASTAAPTVAAGRRQEPAPDSEIHSPPPKNHSDGIDDRLVAAVLLQLTKLVGPIAAVLVKKARKQARDFDTFSRILADGLDPKEGTQFREALAAIKRTVT